jgi:hypothetical protein
MNDNEVFQEVIKENDPQFLEQARQEFPRLKELDIGYKYTPTEDRGFIEFYPEDEPGSPDFPRPKELPMGKPGIEVYNPKTRPIDVAGDIASQSRAATKIATTVPVLSTKLRRRSAL